MDGFQSLHLRFNHCARICVSPDVHIRHIPRALYLMLVGNRLNAGSTIIGDSRALGTAAECRATCMMPRHLRIIVCGGVI
jgi:hypothetical protein